MAAAAAVTRRSVVEIMASPFARRLGAYPLPMTAWPARRLPARLPISAESPAG
jgi:hypothetical protein